MGVLGCQCSFNTPHLIYFIVHNPMLWARQIDQSTGTELKLHLIRQLLQFYNGHNQHLLNQLLCAY